MAAKPQLAFFEQLGSAGWRALEHVCAHARAAGLLVLADAKRGDVPSTAAAYSRALTGPAPGLQADAITANPLMGRDALAPLIDGARTAGAGVFLLVRTSNPGAADVLDLELADGGPLWERLARMTAELGAGGGGAAGGRGGGGGRGRGGRRRPGRRRRGHRRHGARAPRPHARADAAHAVPAARDRRPGGRRRRARASVRPRPRAGLVSASRSIANASRARGGDPPQAARAEAERLRETAWNLVR